MSSDQAVVADERYFFVYQQDGTGFSMVNIPALDNTRNQVLLEDLANNSHKPRATSSHLGEVMSAAFLHWYRVLKASKTGLALGSTIKSPEYWTPSLESR